MKKIIPIFGLAILLSAVVITLAITGEVVQDPVCKMEIEAAEAAAKIEGKSGTVYFCSEQCKKKFCSHPAAYLEHANLTELGIECAAAVKRSCCEKKDVGSASALNPQEKIEEVCTSSCGQTKVPAINEFHAAMMPLEMAVKQSDLAVVKAGAADLVARKEAVMNSECPDGVCSELFKAQRAEFGDRVDGLFTAVQSGDDAAVAEAFDRMHEAYEALDMMAR